MIQWNGPCPNILYKNVCCHYCSLYNRHVPYWNSRGSVLLPMGKKSSFLSLFQAQQSFWTSCLANEINVCNPDESFHGPLQEGRYFFCPIEATFWRTVPVSLDIMWVVRPNTPAYCLERLRAALRQRYSLSLVSKKDHRIVKPCPLILLRTVMRSVVAISLMSQSQRMPKQLHHLLSKTSVGS